MEGLSPLTRNCAKAHCIIAWKKRAAACARISAWLFYPVSRGIILQEAMRFMSKRWLLCALLGSVVWAQAPGTPSAAAPNQAPASAPGAQAPAAPADPGASLPPTTPVLTITIHAPCTSQAKVAAKPSTASTGAAAATKPATTAAKPAECKIVYTKAQFEKMGNALAPNITLQQKRQLASSLPGVLAMSEEAQAKHLDKSDHFTETMKFVKMQYLMRELQRTVQEEATNVPDSEIADYYKNNPEAYEQFNIERIFVPRFKQETPAKDEVADDKTEAPTPEQEKAKQELEKVKQTEGEQELSKLADALQKRAAQGEDFAKLQKEVYDAAGMKIETPNVVLSKVRRTGLPPAHVSVFNLKIGDVSPVFSDAGGHYIYKITSQETLPFDQVKPEIHNALQNQRQRDLMQQLQSSYTSEPNETYFGGPLTPMPRTLPNRMPPPRRAPTPTPQGGATMPPPAATQPPPSNPN
jgi:PPIC-type PPIASE domain